MISKNGQTPRAAQVSGNQYGSCIQTWNHYEIKCVTEHIQISGTNMDWLKSQVVDHIYFSDMKVWALRIVAVMTLIIIGLFCHNKMQAVKNQLLKDSHSKTNIKLQPLGIIKESDETSPDWGGGGGISDSDRDGVKNLKRNLKREKLASLFSQRISLLKEVHHIFIRMMVIVIRHANRWMTQIALIRSRESGVWTHNISW